MKSWLVFVTVVLIAGGAAEASIFQQNPVGGYECAEDMSTDDCFSSPLAVAWQGPTTFA